MGVMKTRSVHPERGIASGTIEREFIVVARVRTRAPIAWFLSEAGRRRYDCLAWVVGPWRAGATTGVVGWDGDMPH